MKLNNRTNRNAKFRKLGISLDKSMKYKPLFEPDHFYHIYNRGNNKENLFREDRNYSFFLGKWEKYLIEYADIWAYCLMPNHFHILIKIGNENRLARFLKSGKSYSELISNQFKNLFISYTKSYNKVYDRSGSLFQKPFKRTKVDSENYLLTLIHYIHHNPIHHKFIDEYESWTWSSYSSILSNRNTSIKRDEVLQLFGGKDAFIKFHEQIKNYKKINHLTIE